MKTTVKHRIYKALKKKNYFEHEKKDSLEVFRKAENLEDVIIEVERNCNFDKLLFSYNPITKKFHRVVLSDEDRKLLKQESKYIVRKECIKRQCLKKAINIDSFIELLDFVFEPIAVFNVHELNIKEDF